MGQNNDLTAILLLLGLGYLVLKGTQASEAITEFRSSMRPVVAYSPAWIPPSGWTPIPGPAMQAPQIGPRFLNTDSPQGEVTTTKIAKIWGPSAVKSRGWLTAADIKTSEKLAFEARRAGLTDF